MVSLIEIQEQTNDLSAEEREELLAFLLRGLKNRPAGPSDAEVLEREREMDSGEVSTVSFSDFVTQAKQR